MPNGLNGAYVVALVGTIYLVNTRPLALIGTDYKNGKRRRFGSGRGGLF